jgi:hypothetical protein
MKHVRVLALFAVLIATAGLASSASAAKPTREPLPIANEQFPGVCSFTVDRHVLVNKSVLTTYSNGDQRITGTFKQRLTNLTTGKFIEPSFAYVVDPGGPR